MTINTLTRLRREARLQKILILFSVLVTGTLLLLANILSSPPSGNPAEKGRPAQRQLSPREKPPESSPSKYAESKAPAPGEGTVTEEPSDLSAGEEVTPPDADRSSSPAARTPAPGTIAGIALRRGHGVPMQRIRLRLTDGQSREAAMTRTGRDGTFSFHGIEPGKYYLETVSKNFSFRPKPIIVADGALTGLSFEVLPRPAAIRIPAYSEFRHGEAVPNIEVQVFRYGKVRYSLYKLALAESFINVIDIDELLASDLSQADPLENFTRNYSYSVPFSEFDDSLDFDLNSPGLYLLEVRAGTDSFRGLISVSAMRIVTTQSGSTLQVLVLGLGAGLARSNALVKAVQNGRLLSEDNTNSSGMFSIDFQNSEAIELLVSDGRSFVYKSVEYHPPNLVSR